MRQLKTYSAVGLGAVHSDGVAGTLSGVELSESLVKHASVK